MIELEQGWGFIQKGLTKLKNNLEGAPQQIFNAEQYVDLYSTVYFMCTQNPENYSQQLFDRFGEFVKEYINSRVLPALRGKHGEFMLKELVKQWKNYKIMVRWIHRIFVYLDRFFIPRRSLPTVGGICFRNFCELVYPEVKTNLCDAVLGLIKGADEGEQIDRDLLNAVLNIIVEICGGDNYAVENEFKTPILDVIKVLKKNNSSKKAPLDNNSIDNASATNINNSFRQNGRASRSSSCEENDGHDICNTISSLYVSKRTAESSITYHTFINYCVRDMRHEFALSLFFGLHRMGLRPFLVFWCGTEVRDAISCATVHIAMFSPRYAESSRRLKELVLMLEAGAMIIPVFYGVKPCDLRYIEKGKYADDFARHEKSMMYSNYELQQWKGALHLVSHVYGSEPKPDDNNEWLSKQMLKHAVLKKVDERLSLDVGERLVEPDEILKDSERKCIPFTASSFSAFQEIGTQFGRKRERSASSSSSFDLFINHRGPDVKRTLASSLYHQLKRMGCRAFLDNQEIKLGDLVPLVLKDAISCASVHVVIFSEQYAESPWCLDELVFMLETGKKIIPVFYGVEPSHLCSMENEAYAQAFLDHERKKRYNTETIQKWKNALITVLQFVEHHRFKPGDDDMVEVVDKISRAVVEEVQKEISLCIAEHPVGLNEIVEDFERQCGLKGREHANIIGIFGMGGSGKTTLAKELFNRKRSQYNASCFLFKVREESSKGELPSLQNKLLRNLLYEDHPTFQSVSEGSSYLRDRVKRSSVSSFFIVLDDIDSMDQLEDLLFKDLASSNSLVIVTTRDEDLLIRAGITLRYGMKEMDERHASELFSWHAFHHPDPVPGYEDLVQRYVKVCGGLPLSLRVLGGYAFGNSDKHDWQSELDKFSKASPESIKKILEISIDALDEEQKQIFMDIACFFVGKSEKTAIRIWGASGWSAKRALHILKDRCLVDVGRNYAKGFEYEDKTVFKMHDQLRDLGRKMAVEESSPRREWQPQHLKSLELERFQDILTQRNDCNLRCFISILDSSIGSQITYFLGNSGSVLDGMSTALLWIRLKLNGSEYDGISPWIPLQDLPCIRIAEGRLGRLWHSNVQAPFLLKELLLHKTSLEDC